jgi:hypothetical protein
MNKPLKQKKCRHCKELFAPFTSMAKACSPGCALELVRSENKKAKSKQWDNKTKELKALPASEVRAKKACHRYIRLRDRNELCACCELPLGEEYHAGHFYEAGNHSFIEFHEDNIHGQTAHCNMHRGGDSGDYEAKLRIKIGDERVDWLKANRSHVIKRTVEDYKAIEAKYNAMYKELVND